MTIWKYILEIEDLQIIRLPKGSKILHIAEQGEQMCLWFQCTPSEPTEERVIAIRGTGHPLPKYTEYLGTGFLQDGQIVFHIFEVFGVPQ